MGGQSKPATSTQTTQTASSSTPWTGAQPYLTDLYGKAMDSLGQVPSGAYAGPRVATQSADTLGGLDLARTNAQTSGMGAPQLRDLAMKTVNGDFLSPDSNPYLKGAISAAIDPVRDNLLQNILPGQASAAQTGGAYGGARDGIVRSMALKDFDTKALDATSALTYGNYTAERQNQMNAGDLFSKANALASAPVGQLLTIGQQEDAHAQALLDAQKSQFQESQSVPDAYKTLAAILTAGGYSSNTGSGTSTTVSTPAQDSLMNQLLKAGLSAASVASLFTPAGPAVAAASGASQAIGSGIGSFGVQW